MDSEEVRKVPLIDRTGDEPKVIGDAEVEFVDGVFEIRANVTDEAMRKALLPKAEFFSIMPDTFKE